MIFTEEQREEFERITRPVIKWLNDELHPRVIVTIQNDYAALHEGVVSYQCFDYFRD